MFRFGRHGLGDMWNDTHRFHKFHGHYAQAHNHCGVFPPVNVYDDGDNYVVSAEIPGVDSENLSIEATANNLKLKGERKRTDDVEGRSYHRQERDHGVFSRSVELPASIDPDKVQARYENGVLEVVLPKAESSKPRQIAIA